MSFRISKGAFGAAERMAAEFTIPTSVYPSAGWPRTCCTEMVVPPPGRGSRTTLWPSFALRRSDMGRAIASPAPPAGNGMTIRTGRTGYDCPYVIELQRQQAASPTQAIKALIENSIFPPVNRSFLAAYDGNVK